MALYTIAPVTEIGEQAICTNESREMDSWEQQCNRKSTHGQSTHLTSLSKTCKVQGGLPIGALCGQCSVRTCAKGLSNWFCLSVSLSVR